MLLPFELLLLGASLVNAGRPSISTIQPALTEILAAQATATASSPVSNVEGVAFNRIVHIWLENTVSFPNINHKSYC